jgi:hypothetical protein
MTELRNKFRLVPMSLRVRELREAGAVTGWLDRELARLPYVVADRATVACAYAMARLAEHPEHPELHEEALAELRCVMDSLWQTDDEMIERAIKDLTELVYNEDRQADVRSLINDDRLFADTLVESADLLADLLRDDDDPDPQLAVLR